jgi:superfamily II DNA or RNA helicase
MFGEDISFKYSWRAYQERVLQEIETHLSDNKLHIIAPPGSGKTVLGLEVVRQLNKRTLILSPTITVRNQWIQRFVELFSDNKFTDYSYSLKESAGLISSTYQGLHSAITGDAQETVPSTKCDLIKILKENCIEVLVLDEAHHLKTEWWKSIIRLVSELGDIRIISLTATPPYDSSAAEWDRYMQLCGPVDAEISVPELVNEKNLCPHQDLIYFSEASDKEHQGIDQFYTKIDQLINEIVENPDFENLIAQHPVVSDPEKYSSDIYENVEYHASLAIFLNSRNNSSYTKLVKVLGLSQSKVPGLSGEWMEILLSNALFKDSALKNKPLFKEIRKSLREHSAIENRRVVLRMKQDFNRLMSSSISKFRSIRDIADYEYGDLGDSLRLVILSDYVRKEALQSSQQIDKFGVIPIFKYLIDDNMGMTMDCRNNIAVLSGTICIIPDSIKSAVRKIGSGYGLSEKDINWNPLKLQPGYSELSLSSSKKNGCVSIITELLTQGHINIIVGTKSLLGEGWDCPAINSLVMATFVGSYMLSNQIRGRAIRADINNIHKTSNIWHLMCLDTTNRYNNYDKDLLEQRFKCFSGLDNENELICNGMDRLRLIDFEFNKLDIQALNNQMTGQASKREELYSRWFDAIDASEDGRIVKEISTPKENLNRTYIFRNTLKHLFLQGIAAAFILVIELYSSTVKSLLRSSFLSTKDLSSIAVLLSFVFILAMMKSTVKALILYFRHGSVERSFKQIARAVINTMTDLKMIENPDLIIINTDTSSEGSVYCSLRHCSSYEQSQFLKAMEEIVEHIQKPRYILSRENKFPFKTLDYHAVPSIFAVNKEKSILFHKHWQRVMGKSKIYYTRNKEGRKILVKARTSSLSSQFVTRTEITDSWKS